MDYTEIQAIVFKTIADLVAPDETQRDYFEISLDKKLTDDLGLDSLDIWDVVIELERKFEKCGLEIPVDDLYPECKRDNSQAARVRHLVDYIHEQLNPSQQQTSAREQPQEINSRL
jgi:acyl carrier protein